MNNTAQATEMTTVREATEIQRTEISKAEICFGAVMAIGAISGMWFVVSLMISYFVRG